MRQAWKRVPFLGGGRCSRRSAPAPAPGTRAPRVPPIPPRCGRRRSVQDPACIREGRGSPRSEPTGVRRRVRPIPGPGTDPRRCRPLRPAAPQQPPGRGPRSRGARGRKDSRQPAPTRPKRFPSSAVVVSRGRITRFGDVLRRGIGGRDRPRVGPGDHIEGQRGVAHRPGERPHDVPVGRVDGYHTLQGHQPEGGLEADQRLGRGRVLDRAAGFRAEAQHREAGVDGGRGPSARSARDAVGRIGVQRLARHGAAGTGPVAGEVGHVRLAQDDRTGSLQPLHRGRIVPGHHVDAPGRGAEAVEARSGHQPRVVQIVLDHDRDAVKGTARPRCAQLVVQRGGHGQRLRIH